MDPVPQSASRDEALTWKRLLGSFKTGISLVVAVVGLMTAGAKLFKWASDSGAEQATAAAAQTLLKTRMEDHEARLIVLRGEMDIVKLQNQRSLDDRAALHTSEDRIASEAKENFQHLDAKLDQIILGQRQKP